MTVDKRKVKHHRWAKLLQRMFRTDVGSCPRCGGDMEIRGAVVDPTEIRRYLRGIGLKEHPPPIASARAERAPLDFDRGRHDRQRSDPQSRGP